MLRLCRPRERLGFTKVELLIVIAIVTIIIGAMVPVVQRVREDNNRSQCMDNLKQIGLATLKFEASHKRLPPLYGGAASETDKASIKFPNIWGSTHVFLLPFVGQEDIWKSIATGDPVHFDPSLAKIKLVQTFLCPSDPSAPVSTNLGGTSYTANAQVFARLNDETLERGGFMVQPPTPNYCDRGAPISRLSDGSTNILLFMHSYSLCGLEGKVAAWNYTTSAGRGPSTTQSLQPWSRATYIGQKAQLADKEMVYRNQPTADGAGSNRCDPLIPATPHRNALLVVLGDASVRAIAPDIMQSTWNDICMPMNHSGIHDYSHD